MTTKVNGASTPGEFVGKNLEFWTITSTLDLTPTGVSNQPYDSVLAPNATLNVEAVYPFVYGGQTYANYAALNAAFVTQQRFDRVIETISTRAQPIILGAVTVSTLPAPVVGLPVTNALSSGTPVTVYSVRFAIEQPLAWDTTVTLADTLNGVSGLISTLPSTSNNVSVVKADLL